LKAISELQVKFPYAVTLLIYTVLERCLKLYLLKNRKTLTEHQFNLKVTANNMKLKQAVRTHKDLIGFLTDCTLSKLEDIYKIYKKDPHRKDKYSTCRNDVIHSKLFFRQQLGSDYSSRNKQNRGYLKDAKKHLIEASEKYFREKIITQSDVSSTMKLSESQAPAVPQRAIQGAETHGRWGRYDLKANLSAAQQ